ncbi:uncharacterized protein [Rutidosis leptorrhynchoides]|uniref:uncharacterized protein n=1 Tax=Rutidosis leptorrhynchoides TaxID=125765 RepID=UPI003A990DD4
MTGCLSLTTLSTSDTTRGKQNKLSPKFNGSFCIVARVGEVAYKLQLPSTSRIHSVFHVSQLKPYKGLYTPVMGWLPQVNEEGLLALVPHKILDRKLVKKNNRGVVYALIQWQNGSADDATWEPLDDIIKSFPEFDVLSTHS